jgi:hypothetical protein
MGESYRRSYSPYGGQKGKKERERNQDSITSSRVHPPIASFLKITLPPNKTRSW